MHKICVVTYNWCEEGVEVIDSGQPKISELHSAVKGHKKILRFEVTVNNPVTVQEVHPTKDLKHKVLE